MKKATLVLLCMMVAACEPVAGKGASTTDRDPSGVGDASDAGDHAAASGGHGSMASSGGSDTGTDIGSEADGGNALPEDEDAALRRALLDKGVACSVVENDIPEARFRRIEDDYDRCVATCIIGAPCDSVANYYCNPGQQDSLATCIGSCSTGPADGFECADGTKIPHAFVCDITLGDCPGTDDEGKQCGTYSCDDGQVLYSDDLRCDAFPHCSDGSDELRCGLTCGGA